MAVLWVKDSVFLLLQSVIERYNRGYNQPNSKGNKMRKPRVQKSIEILDHIDPTKKVRVYRNLHKDCFSVKQDGLVRCHADNVTLFNVEFIVSKAGQRRVRDEKKKNVHAFVEGFVVDTREADNYVDGNWSDEQIERGQQVQ